MIKKVKAAPYLCMTITSRRLNVESNMERGKKVLREIRSIESASRLTMKAPIGSISYALNTYCRSKYDYNAILIKEEDKVLKWTRR